MCHGWHLPLFTHTLTLIRHNVMWVLRPLKGKDIYSRADAIIVILNCYSLAPSPSPLCLGVNMEQKDLIEFQTNSLNFTNHSQTFTFSVNTALCSDQRFRNI